MAGIHRHRRATLRPAYHLTIRTATVPGSVPSMFKGDTMPTKPMGKKGQIKHYYASDGRLIGMLIPGEFDDYVSFPPHMDTEEERKHMETAYTTDVDMEAQTKAHVTADAMPMQIILLNRHQGSKVNPHYHLNDDPAQSDTRHQIMICKKGRARIGLYARDGEHVDTVELLPNDLILMTEGHAIEFVDEDTRLIEVKMGPFPKTDTADKVDIDAKF